MNIEIIDNNFGSKFQELLKKTTSSLSISSPFISYKTASYLASWLENHDQIIQCQLITRFNREDFIQGVNSLEALEQLYNVGVKLFSLQHLHSKIYIFDNSSVLLGSANFTFKGLFKNHEFGVFIQNESEFISNTVQYFNDLIERIQKFEIDISLIEKEKEEVNKLLSERTSSSTAYRNRKRWGAILDDNENNRELNDPEWIPEKKDFVEDFIDEEEQFEEINTGIWIKFEGNSDSRIPNDKVYINRKKELHEYIERTYYPRPPRGVKNGDLIFIAMVSKSKTGIETPVIVGYAYAKGFSNNNKIDHTDSNYKRWNNRYPYYIELFNGKFLNSPIREGIPLIELCNTLRHKLYPRTINNPDTDITRITRRHHQKPHIQITNHAKDYLVNQLDNKFQENGHDLI
ncbi:phospholipase D family protein [Halobacillus sp. B29]|uniref:phospholipase D family protein n=1 Tax=Halobacillus sp. B29 TaxID=3457432 RepID=UPI003FCE44FE